MEIECLCTQSAAGFESGKEEKRKIAVSHRSFRQIGRGLQFLDLTKAAQDQPADTVSGVFVNESSQRITTATMRPPERISLASDEH